MARSFIYISVWYTHVYLRWRERYSRFIAEVDGQIAIFAHFFLLVVLSIFISFGGGEDRGSCRLLSDGGNENAQVRLDMAM